jgi:hypothetical protein
MNLYLLLTTALLVRRSDPSFVPLFDKSLKSTKIVVLLTNISDAILGFPIKGHYSEISVAFFDVLRYS